MLIILLIGLALAIPATFLLRSNPDWARWVGGWLALLLLGCLVWSPSLKLPNPNGETTPPRVTGLVASTLTLAAFNLIFPWNPVTVRLSFSLVTVAFVTLLLFVWWASGRAALLEKLLASRVGNIAFALGYIALSSGFLWGAYLWDNAVRTGPSSGSPTSWATQLSLVQAEAKRINPNALLGTSDVTAWPADDGLTDFTPDNALRVEFEFRTTSIGVDLVYNDSMPTSTIHMEDAPTGTYALAAQRQNLLNERLAQVKLTPRDAWRLTWQEALTHAQKHNLRIHPIIGLDLEALPDGSNTTTSAWFVTYWPRAASQGDWTVQDKDAGSLNYSSFFLVDAQTGKILKRELKEPQPPSP